MKIKSFTQKTIEFTEEERPKVSRFVARLVKNGWSLEEGDFGKDVNWRYIFAKDYKDELVYGITPFEDAGYEEVSLIK